MSEIIWLRGLIYLLLYVSVTGHAATSAPQCVSLSVCFEEGNKRPGCCSLALLARRGLSAAPRVLADKEKIAAEHVKDVGFMK